MAGKANSGKSDIQLSGKQFKELSNQIEKLFRRSSDDLRDVLREVMIQMTDMAETLQTSLGNQTIETLAAIRSAGDSVKRSDITSADMLSQVSSLRDYLARQQNLVKRFQDGYDWTVLKNFCQRIIRTIDDIEKRMNSGDSMSDAHRQDLEMIYDQLVFTLDGSGIEQFRPEADIPYTGQEKIAEVVGKDTTEDDNKTGNISRVINPGYYYYVSEEHQKLIRPAKVRLYMKKPEGSDEVE